MPFMAIADTAFVFAVLDRKDPHHVEALQFYNAIQGEVLLPTVALTEIAYHIYQLGGGRLVAEALAEIHQGPLTINDLDPPDYERVEEILRKYHDSRIDFVDASIMALAERLNIIRILTYDHRDFRLYRPSHCSAFEILP